MQQCYRVKVNGSPVDITGRLQYLTNIKHSERMIIEVSDVKNGDIVGVLHTELSRESSKICQYLKNDELYCNWCVDHVVDGYRFALEKVYSRDKCFNVCLRIYKKDELFNHLIGLPIVDKEL